LAQHLAHERPYLFSFLHCPGIEATNNRAERAIRPTVRARNTWGGNRTEKGARMQEILCSVLATCGVRGHDAFPQLIELLRSAEPVVLDILPATGPAQAPA
jgi:transposase